MISLPDGMVDVTLMCFDLDGTLAASDHRPTRRSLAALADLAATGVRVVIITGRGLPEALAVLQEGQIDGVAIASNGAIVADGLSERVLRRTALPEDVIRRGFEYTATRPLEPVLFTDTQHLVRPDSPVTDMLREVNPAVETLEVPFEEMDLGSVNKMCLIGEPADLDALDAEAREVFPGLVRSMDGIFDVSPEGADKGATLAAFLRENGVDPAHVAGVGDSENDVAWLSLIGFPVAVSNAMPAVKEVATTHIGHHDEEAVAELVEAIVAARRG